MSFCVSVFASVGLCNIAVFGQSLLQITRKQPADTANGCSFSSTSRVYGITNIPLWYVNVLQNIVQRVFVKICALLFKTKHTHASCVHTTLQLE